MSKLTEIGESIAKQWNKYWDLLYTLPDFIGFPLALLSVIIPLSLACHITAHTLNLVDRTRCLDSPYPRRYTNFCEEWIDGEWTEANLSDDIIYYNDAANKINK